MSAAVAVPVALASAACFATATAFQHRVAAALPDRADRRRGLLLSLASRPVWLASNLLSVAGLVLHSVALATGPLLLVQPLLVTGLLFALPISARLHHTRVSARQWSWASVTVLALAVFLALTSSGGGHSAPQLRDPTVLLVSLGVVVLASAAAALSRAGRARAALFGVAAGSAAGLGAAAIKATAGLLQDGRHAVLFSPYPYAALVLGTAAFGLTQLAYRAGPLASCLPTLTLCDPVVSIAVGIGLFAERLRGGTATHLVELAVLVLTFSAVVVLARSETTAAPGRGPQGGARPGPGSQPENQPGRRRDGTSGLLRTARGRVVIVSGSVGAGHDGAADELAGRLRAAPWSCGTAASLEDGDALDVQVVDYLALLPAAAAALLTRGYQQSVQRAPWLFAWIFARIETDRLVFGAAALLCRLPGRRLLALVTDADVVVSTYPLASRTLGELRRTGRLRVPCLTYLTDPAPHRLWVHPSIDRHLTVTQATADAGLLLYGVAMTAAGPLVPARFTATPAPDTRSGLRDELGLQPGDLAVLLTAGSLGLGAVEQSVAAVHAAGAVPVVLCGHNNRLQRRLQHAGHLALGWRPDVAELLHAVDVLVHNAGGLSFTEALVSGVPAVSYAPLPGHGAANAELLNRTGLAPLAHSPVALRHALHRAVRAGSPLLPDMTDASQHVQELLATQLTAGVPDRVLLAG